LRPKQTSGDELDRNEPAVHDTSPDDTPPLPLSPLIPADPTSNLDLPIAVHKGKRSWSYPISSYVLSAHFSFIFKSFVASVDFISLPKTLTAALNHDGWKHAMEEEMMALETNATWELVPLP